MNNAMNTEVPALDGDEFDVEANPAGEMALSSRTKVGVRTRVLSGLALTAGMAVLAYGTTTFTTVSAPGNM
ncbi:hypothetical protein ACFFQW_40510 [Umezawaea endophytica]|uniref:Uncharacterized protein n=1 Tax=Umezawaea endophytica TaxID=1654476 RepID=A0A9X2VWH7_9PSEU|nr:hypothetical protein [Umezawaea endophytica]MCS7484176.1 hypothetical protein [Umezawaea endophytica]